jgi:hypothetical protein
MALVVDWNPVQTYSVWGFGPSSADPCPGGEYETTAVSRGISTDVRGRVFTCYGMQFPPHKFSAVCCDNGRVVPVHLRLTADDVHNKPHSLTVSPDGEWLYVLDDAGGIWRLAAGRTGQWGEPELVVPPSRSMEEVRRDDIDPVLHDLSMICTGDALWYWRHDLRFVHVPLSTCEPRIVHKEVCKGWCGHGGIRWWMLDPSRNVLVYEGEVAAGIVEVDIVTGEVSVSTAFRTVSPVSGWSLRADGMWPGTSKLALGEYENALFMFRGFPPQTADAVPLIGGASDLEHGCIHDALVRGEPSSVGRVKHAVVDVEGQLWLTDTRQYTITDGVPDDDDVNSIALRCVRPAAAPLPPSTHLAEAMEWAARTA